MNPFQLESPSSLDKALGILAERKEQARILAGGTDLLVEMQDDYWPAPEIVLSLRNLEEGLRYIRQRGDTMHLGALATYTDILDSPVLRESAPLLLLASAEVGSPQIRNRGTLAGNVAMASPAGDAIPALYCLDAEVELRSRSVRRVLAIEDCFLRPKQNAFQPDEMIVEIRFPVPPPEAKVFFYKVGPRLAQAITKVTVAGLVVLQGERVEQCRLAFGAVAPTVRRAVRSEALLAGQTLCGDLIERASELAKEECSPIDDIRSEGWYRREMVATLLRRGLWSILDPSVSPCRVFPD